MSVGFSCPSCGAKGLVDESFAGRQVRCKQCRYRFAIPAVGEVESGGYALDGPALLKADPETMGAARGPESVYSPTRSDEPPAKARRRPTKRPGEATRRRPARIEGPGFAWGAWLIWGGLVALGILGLVAMVAPNGVKIAGSALVILGTLMFVVGFGAGAFGAFSEDLLYGLLYVVFPLYTAYYLVTRWQDLWRWFACSTAGVVLIQVGTTMLRSTGMET